VNSLKTRGIVLKRTNYGEADRIVTLLTPDYGKLRLMARGVRKPKAKLAGGIELFSVSDVSFIRGKGEIGTLISTRLAKHYGQIVNDIARVQTGYDLLKQLDQVTEDEPEDEYFELLEQALKALDEAGVDLVLIRAWFGARLLKLSGHEPNLDTAPTGAKLTDGQNYVFDFEHMAFEPKPRGRFSPGDIKFLRLLFSGASPKALNRVGDIDSLTAKASPLVQTMLHDHLKL
jgi:DNA repair protein RecO (recombination protein O)